MLIENLPITDEVRRKISESISDVSIDERYGVAFVTGSIDGNTQKMAGQGFARVFKDGFPDAVPLRLDQDLVSVADIAQRLNRTSEAVEALISGTEGPGGFPIPIGVVNGEIAIWPWAVVVKWIQEELGQDLGLSLLQPEASAAVDANLASRRLIGVDHSKGGL